MTSSLPTHARQLVTLLKGSGEIEVRLDRVPVPTPREDQVLVRIEAAPISPSDLALLFGAADLSNLSARGSGEDAVLTAPVPAAAVRAMSGRIDQVLRAGNEGAGTVVAAGGSPAAQALIGRRVAAIGGSMLADYICLPVSQCLVLPDAASAADGASALVNPLTVLAMVETMRHEGHTAMVQTAAASNLGQMLNRVCVEDGIGLVNVVRKAEHVSLLRGQGATHVYDSTSPEFRVELTEALAATGATLGFDAIGGGKIVSQILAAMEVVAQRSATAYSRYGTEVHKQVYLYGVLDRSPTELTRSFGFAWGIGGWLLFPRLRQFGTVAVERMKARIASGLTTTFASTYSERIALADVLKPEHVARYSRQATGEKFLILPGEAR